MFLYIYIYIYIYIVKVTLRPTVSRPVRLGVRRPSGTRDQFFFLLEFFFRTVAVRYLVASSLTRGRVCMRTVGTAQTCENCIKKIFSCEPNYQILYFVLVSRLKENVNVYLLASDALFCSVLVEGKEICVSNHSSSIFYM
jgi:hypothetical protein